MSNESLRDALEKLAAGWMAMDCRVDLPENAQWSEGLAQGYANAAADLLRKLIAHPAESVPVADRERAEMALRNRIAEWYGAEWDPKDDTFYEIDDGGVLNDEDEAAMHTYRGAKWALAAGVFRSEAVALDREAVARVCHDAMPFHQHDWKDLRRCAKGHRDLYWAQADAVLQLARPEAVVKAEALRQAAEDIYELDPEKYDEFSVGIGAAAKLLTERADELDPPEAGR